MVAIIIIAKELSIMIISNVYTQCFFLSRTEYIKLRVSPFSSVPAPTWVLFPALFT